MSYGDNDFKKRGIERQPIILRSTIRSLKDNGYKVDYKTTRIDQDMKDKIWFITPCEKKALVAEKMGG